VAPPPYATGLPQYVKYIFYFAVGILGIVIFGALVYSGFQYLTSVGDPTKMGEARSGIVSAFIGAIILLSSILIFNTINPQLTKIELAPIPLVEARVQPGIYVCNYKVKNIGEILHDYLTGDEKTQTEAMKKLQKIMWNPKTQQACLRLNFSGNFGNFSVTKENTIFIIPTIEKSPEGKKNYKWEYGVILHQLENQKGRATFLPKVGDGKIFVESEDPNADPMRKYGYSAKDLDFKDLDFTARSFTVLKKPYKEEKGEGVKLYPEPNFCQDVPIDEKEGCLSKVGIVDPDGKDFTSEIKGLKDNPWSISFHPVGTYVAILFKSNGDSLKNEAVVFTKNDSDLSRKLFICGTGCNTPIIKYAIKLGEWLWSLVGVNYKQCHPCFGSIIVIKAYAL
jgi:hypothetical protein